MPETEAARRQAVLERGWAAHKAAQRTPRLLNAICVAVNCCGCRPVLGEMAAAGIDTEGCALVHDGFRSVPPELAGQVILRPSADLQRDIARMHRLACDGGLAGISIFCVPTGLLMDFPVDVFREALAAALAAPEVQGDVRIKKGVRRQSALGVAVEVLLARAPLYYFHFHFTRHGTRLRLKPPVASPLSGLHLRTGLHIQHTGTLRDDAWW